MAVQHAADDVEFNSLLSSNMYVVADFYAAWCPPCKQMEPIYEQFATKYSVPGYLAFVKVNVDDNQDLASEYGVRAMPTFMFFKNRNRVGVYGQAQICGADKKKLEGAVERLSELAKSKEAAGVQWGE